MRVSVKALQYFLSAAESGSIAKAAQTHNVVPSAISSAVELVEEEFQLKLVQRYPAKGIEPTAAGVAIVRKIRHLIEEYDNLFLEGAELRSALAGSLSIGYYAPVAPAFLPAILGPLVQDHPKVRLSLIESDNEQVQNGLLAGEFDVILFVAENVRRGVFFETLIEAPPYLLAPRDHAVAARAFVTPDDLRDLPFVLLDLPVTRDYYRSIVDEGLPDSSIVATASTLEMVRSLVGTGLGCSILNMLPAAEHTYAGDRVVAVPFRSKTRPLKLGLGHLGGKSRRLVRAFIEASRRYFTQPAAQKLIVPAKPPRG